MKRKFLSVFLTLIAFLLASCSNWMKSDDFYDKIENDVKVANASSVSVYVRYANSKMGLTDPSGYTTLKKGIPADLNAVTNDDYGFIKWVAFSTSDFAANKQHSNLFYDTAEKYEETFKSLEIPSSEVSFEDPANPSTKVTINTTRSDIFITPLVAKRPTVVTSVPSNGRSDVVRNTSIRILFSKKIDPTSLKDEFGNSNIVVTSGSAVLTETSGDLSAKDVTENCTITLGKTGKMLTISPKQGFYFDNNSQITVNIYEDVCDSDGYGMNGKYSFSFTTGVKLDSLAPRIEELFASIDDDFTEGHRFEQYKYISGSETPPVYKTEIDSATNNLSDYTSTTGGSHYGTGKKQILEQRVKDYLNIYVRAADIAGSGGNIDTSDTNTLSESDVALIQVRACLYIDKDGDAVTTSKAAFADDTTVSSDYYLETKDIGYAPGLKDSDCKVQQTFESVFPNKAGGTLFTYDLTSLPDGLIKIDIWAVDMVGNSGETESYVKQEYNNNYRSIFVVKDSTAPDAAKAKTQIQITSEDENHNNPAPYKWYNSNALSHMKIQDKKDDIATNLIKDLNNENLSSNMNDLMWAFKLGSDTNWKPSANAENIWSSIHTNGQPLVKAMSDAAVSSDGPVYITMCLKDDLGNVSDPVVLDAINYDNTAPGVPSTVSWVKEKNSSPGTFEDIVATTDKASLSQSGHILKIPFTEQMAGLRRMQITVTKNGSSTPIQQDAYSVYYVPESGTARTLSFTQNSTDLKFLDVDDSNKVTSGTLYIYGIKINDETGSYNITVDMWDSSLNKSTTTSDISIDTTAPVIKRIYIPGLKKSVTPASTSNETDTTGDSDGWFLPHEYVLGSNVNTSAEHSKPGYIPLYLFIKEEDSGVKKIEFESDTSNSVELFKSAAEDGSHGKTKLYLVSNCGQQNESKTAISESDYEVESSTIIFKDDKCVSATGDFVLLLDNVGFKNITTDLEKVNVTVTDLANLVGSKNEISTSVNETTGISGIKVDSYMNASATTYLLEDRRTEAECCEAQPGYTNETTVNLKITFDDDYIKVNNVESASSGYNRIKIISGASIDANTKIFYGTKELPYQVNSDGSVTLRKKDGQNFTDYYVIRGNEPIVIKNLKLNSNTEGAIKVKVKTYDLAGWENSETETTIVYDKTKPVWKGKGLYSAAESRVNSENVYPHSGKSDAEDKTPYYGITFNGSDDLYFYKNQASTFIRIEPDLTEDNYHAVHWGGAGDAEYFYYSTQGTYTVYAYDKAGNKSDQITFKLVDVSELVTDEASRANIKVNLENDVQLVVPEGADSQKNTFLNGVRTPEGPSDSSTYDYGSQSYKIWVFNYVLKQFNGKNYQLKVPVHTYSEGGVKTVPIEQYGVSHQYTAFPSNMSDCGGDAFIPRDPNWHPYTKNSQAKSDGHLSTYVDANGDVIITLPNHNCPPISLWLKDACGNTEFILLNPGLKNKLGNLSVCTSRPDGDPSRGKRNQAVAYVFDNRVGVNDEHAGTVNSYYPDDTTVRKSDITFYKLNGTNIPYIEISSISDNCRFTPASSGTGNIATDQWNYSMKSRIIVWQQDGTPTQESFYAQGISGSDWVSYKEKYEEAGGSSAFSLFDYFPTFDNTAHNTKKFELWYIIEDRVGNYEIDRINNKDYGSITNWLYDVTPPKLDVKEATNVNNVDGKNYYSDSSSVKYSIEDKQSGIQHNGSISYTYSSFASRVQLYPETGLTDYPLSGKTPDSNGKISIEHVKDWAENEVSSVGLENAGSNIWVYQPNPPAFASSSPVQITAENPNGKRFNTGPSNGAWYIDSSRWITHIQLKMTLDDNEPLLGWIIKNDDSDPENKIYTVADTQSQNGNPAVLTQIPHSGKVYTYSIDKTKKSGNQTVDDTNTTWNNYFKKKPLKFYAVNRAGIITPDPIVINFEELPVPALDGSLEYSDVIKYPSSDSTDNYIKSASKVIFKTKENPDKCTIFVGSDSVTFTLSEYLNDSTGKYEIPLGTDAKLKAASGAALKLVLSITGGEDSDEIELKGPANKNKWTFDETAPSISVASVKTVKQSGNTAALKNLFDSSDKTYYIEGDNAVIDFDTSDTDIAKWQKKLSTEGDSVYADMTLANDKTITLDVNKTYNFRAIDKAGNVSTVQTVALKKDVSAPDGTVTYKLKNDNNDAESGSYTDSNGTIVYNTSKVNKLYIVLTSVNDPDGNGLHFYKQEDAATATEITPDVNEGVKSYEISLSTTDAVNKTYTISVKDNVGKETTLKTFTVTADGSFPDISLADNPVNGYKSGSGSNIKYYVSEATTYITFATPTATDVKGYKVSTDGTNYSDELISIDENRRYAVTTPDNQTYYFKSVDNVGHESSGAVSVTVVKDVTAPSITEGSELTFTAQTESGTAVLVNNSVGDYKVTESNNVITIVYNSSVKTMTFDSTCMQDTGSGFKAFYYKSASGNPHDMTDNKITLDATWSNKEYGLYAEDNAGNAALIKTLNFTADSTGPEITSGVTTVSWHDRNVKQVNGYTSTMGLIPYAKWVKVDDRQRVSYYTSGTKLMFAKTAIPGAVQYQLVQKVTTGNTAQTDGYTATAGNDWQSMVVSDDGNNFVFALPDIKTPYTRLSLFFRDELGNVSGPYYLGNNNEGQHGIQWWITGAPIKAGDTTITSITYNNNGTVTNGWGGKAHDYTVTLTLPVGTLIKSVFLSPKPGNANTGVVFSTSLPTGITNALQFSGYTTETDGMKNNYDSEGYIVLPSAAGSETGTITMVIYPHDVEDANKVNILVKFNGDSVDATGVPRQLFNTDGGLYNNRISMSSSFPMGIDTSKLVSARDLAGTQISTMSGPGIIMNKDLEATYVTSSTSGQSRAAKKAAKAAKKAAKNAAKAAKSQKAPLVEEVLAQVEDAVVQVSEEVVNEAVAPDSTPAPEKAAAVQSVAQAPVKEAVVVSPAPAIESSAQSTENTPAAHSKPALWIVLCAFLAAAAGIVVVLRKKRG